LPLALLLANFGRGSYGPRGDGAWWPLVPLVGWLLTLAVIGLIVWLVVRRRPASFEGRPGWGQQPPWAAAPPRPDSALEIARARYARGEMSRDEYLRVTSDLGGPPPGPEAPPSPPAPTP
jgi:uncharacterized membrane protein